MPQATGRPAFDAIARRGMALTERRLLDLSELYRSGRWTHYFASRQQFAAHMLDAIKLANAWTRLAGARCLDAPQDHSRRAA